MNDKETIRTSRLETLAAAASIDSKAGGKIAEQLRKTDTYRQARRLFVTPPPLLLQIRINCLLDGKELIMPSPGLTDGFILITPHTIPFKKLSHAVTYKGLQKFGTNLAPATLAGLPVDVVVCDAVAVDRRGGRLGDGRGFLDLACGLLGELGAVGEKTTYLAAVETEQLLVERIPVEPWDIILSGIITTAGPRLFSAEPSVVPRIHWPALPEKIIRKSNPLWQLYKKTAQK